MDEKPNHCITVLVEGNNEVWHIQMIAVLVAADLWDVTRPAGEVITEEMPKGPKAVQVLQEKQELARSKITLAVDASQLPFVMGMGSPRDIWAVLEELSHTPCLASTIDTILVITEGLLPQYVPVLTLLEFLPFESLTIAAVTTRVMGFEAQVSRAQASVTDFTPDLFALVTRTEVICHQCNGFGQYRSEFPTPKNMTKPKNTQGAHGNGEETDARLQAGVADADRPLHARFVHTGVSLDEKVIWLY